ncbi:hypothetical protein CVT24_011526 [Panaeolus cyanescens]|uniref:Uncharacterized protein n=1 Tax=Panaeolus cyanescens TaxID=181874 RepID=A0A409VMJ0_9AGAR|nr:hypothetical protein CVT24_011526 [Panaeolus cyanescens]
MATFAYVLWKFLCLATGPKRIGSKHLGAQRDVLAALASVFIPTKAAWTYQYQDLFADACVTESAKIINIDASQLFKNLVNGQLEIRSTDDISLLVQGKLLVYGWNIRLAFSAKWKIVLLAWLLNQYMRSNNVDCLSIILMLSQLNIFVVSSQGIHLVHKVDMDHVPNREKENFIKNFAQLADRDSLVLEFTCFADHLRWPGQPFIACTVPFLPSDHRRCSKPHPERFSTLLYGLREYMAIFPPKGLQVSKLADISAERRKSLERRAQDFTNNQQWRTAYIEHHNMLCWQATRVKLLWEAGLLASGLIYRLRVTIVKKANDSTFK